jgi:hypothetical protein
MPMIDSFTLCVLPMVKHLGILQTRLPSDLVVIGFSLNVQHYPEFKPAHVKAEVYTVEPSQEKVSKLTLHTCTATTGLFLDQLKGLSHQILGSFLYIFIYIWVRRRDC